MESNYYLDIDTAWTFPILKYTSNVSYVEVRKASGIAFILLELIEHSENRAESMAATLSGLGVPKDILYIFADEVSNLINYQILEMSSGRIYSADYFDSYRLEDFNMTELGKKLFAEGAIPTGSNSSRRIQILFDTVKKDIYQRFPGTLHRIEASSIDSSCVSDVILNSKDIEEYIVENASELGFKKGESITGYSHDETELLAYKSEKAVNIKIDGERMYIKANDSLSDNYIKKYYSPEVISRIIQTKKKFLFPDYIGDVPEYDYPGSANIVRIMLPSQINQIPTEKCQITLCRRSVMKNSVCSLESDEAAAVMNNCEIKGYACYFKNGQLYSVTPAKYNVSIDGYANKCMVSLIVISVLGGDIKQRLTALLFNRCLNSADALAQCKMVKELFEISRNAEYIDRFTKTVIVRLRKSEDKVDMLDNLDRQFKNTDVWRDTAYSAAEGLFSELCSKINLDSLSAIELLCQKLNKFLEYDSLEYLQRISRNLIESYDNDSTFDALVNRGFNETSVLGVVNVFKDYCTAILNGTGIGGHSSIAVHCSLIGSALSEMKLLSGIYNANVDSANLDIDSETFVKAYSSFAVNIKKIEKYKMFAADEFEQICCFFKRFSELNEIIAIEMEASKNPQKINKAYIEQMLRKSRYKDAICDLHIRLQYELNRLYRSKKASTYQLLSNPDIGDYLDSDELIEMHALRKCRNEFQHPSDKQQIRYSSDMIINWCQIIEKIGGLTNESRSKN